MSARQLRGTLAIGGAPEDVSGLNPQSHHKSIQGRTTHSQGASQQTHLPGSEAASPVSSIGQSADQQGTDNSEIGEVVSLIGQSASQETILNETNDGTGESSSSSEQQEEELKTEISSSSSHFSSDDDDGEDRARSGSGATRLSSVSVCESGEGRFRIGSGATLCGELLFGADEVEGGAASCVEDPSKGAQESSSGKDGALTMV